MKDNITLVICDECYALVEEDYEHWHKEYHEILKERIERLKLLTKAKTVILK